MDIVALYGVPFADLPDEAPAGNEVSGEDWLVRHTMETKDMTEDEARADIDALRQRIQVG